MNSRIRSSSSATRSDGVKSTGGRLPATRSKGGLMAERWFSEEELEEMSRPTMDRAIEAIEAGDLEQAKAPFEAMKARVALPARHDGRRHRRLHDLDQGELRRGGARPLPA